MIISLQLIATYCFLALSLSLSYAEVTLTVEKGSALPGATDSTVVVSLENPNDQVKGIQIDICDGEDYISYTGCKTTERTTDLSCSHQKLDRGCCRVLLFSFTGSMIEEGAGPIFTLCFDVSEEVPVGECRDLKLEKTQVIVESDKEMSTEDAVIEQGEFCFLTPLTTTTITPITTMPTTTTTISPRYEVSISPKSAIIDSNETLVFRAKTTFAGGEVEGTYIWAIVPASAIGSTIDEKGIFNAGENTGYSEIVENVELTDIAHENKSATVIVTIKVKKEVPSECEFKINPSSATLSSGDTLILIAYYTNGDECEPDEYKWSIESQIGSVIDQKGYYAAGNNDAGSQMT